MKLLQHLALHYNLNAGPNDEVIESLQEASGCDVVFHRSLVWKKRRRNARLLAKILWDTILYMKGLDLVELLKYIPILHDAARVGNIGFITMITSNNPQLIFTADSNGHSVFHIAILERHDDVFSLIYKIGPMIEVISSIPDKDGNNMLHLAAKLAHPKRLSIVSGVALQLQREILWFKRVEELVSSLCIEMKNGEGLRPRELFSMEHKELFEEGEKWIKETSNYIMVVATLVATMAFAAGITVSGGNNDETGMPIFSNRIRFETFIVSNMIAMFCSTTSIILFLSIYVSHFQEKSFLVVLPMKLMFGFLMIFISIVGIMFTFTSAFILYEDDNPSASRWVPVGVSAILIAIFVIGHYKYFIDAIRLAYRSKFPVRKSKYKLS